MNVRIDYGCGTIKDLTVTTKPAVKGKPPVVEEVLVRGEPVKPTARFWTSLQVRFGFSTNVFKYFRHDEVFQRISEVATNDKVRWCVERNADGRNRLLALTNPEAALIPHADLKALLHKYGVEDTSYSEGVLRSTHAPRAQGNFAVAGDAFQHRYVIDTPVDGFGRPAVYLSLLRLLCTNGAVGYGRAFRSEVNVGKGGGDGVAYALLRVLDGFNNEEGYAAFRQRFEAAARSWASVNEANKMYRTLLRLHHRGAVGARAQEPAAAPSVRTCTTGQDILNRFHTLTGDLTRTYGLANLDALSVKRQRTLPSACKVYELINFASEVATHHAAADGARQLQAHIGELVSNEYDLEGTVDRFGEWRDFFIGHGDTTATLTEMGRR